MKALVGAVERRPQRLLGEVAALRRRTAELERELAYVRAENAALRAELDERRDLDITPAESVLSAR